MVIADCLGIEIGGTKLQVGLGNGLGLIQTLRRANVDRDAGATGILQQILRLTDEITGEVGLSRNDLSAVGIGFGGPIDPSHNAVKRSHQIEGWDNFPIAEWVERELGVGFFALENDADIAALAEYRFGAGAGHSPVLYLTIGSGIGGGVIRSGQIDHGAGHGAAEIGHHWVKLPDEFGVGGETVESMGSGWSITRRAESLMNCERGEGNSLPSDPIFHRSADLNTEEIAQAATRGSKIAQSVLDDAVEAVAIGLAAAVGLIGPSRIILGGGVSKLGENQWFKPIRARLGTLVFPPFRQTFDVVPARLGDEVVVQGALARARDERMRD